MRANQATLDLIKHFEGLFFDAYICPGGVWTIGYGHTGLRHNDGTVKRGRKVTLSEAEKLLKHDLRYFERAVDRLVKVPLNENQFGALVSFTFNVGEGALGRSTLLKKLNAGDYAGAAKQFARWNRGGGRVLRGLTRRRAAEAALFMKEP